MDSNKKKELDLWAAKIRKTALQTIQTAGSGHIGGSFSLGEILAVLYFDKMILIPRIPTRRTETVWCSPRDTAHRLSTPPWL